MKKQEYTKEELERMALIISINAMQDRFQFEKSQSKALHELAIDHNVLTTRSLELIVQERKNAHCPHRMYPTEIFYDSVEKKYVCRLPVYDAEEDEPQAVSIQAYGDTPGQACDNFDNLWVHGEKQ